MQEFWCKATKFSRHLRAVHDAAVVSLCRSQQYVVWALWMSQCRLRRRSHHLQIKAVILHQGVTLSKGMCAFKIHLENRRSQALQHGRALLYNMQRKCTRIVHAWRAYADGKRWRRRQLAVATSRAALRCLRACLMALVRHADAHKSARNVFVNMLMSFRSQMEISILAKAVACWHEAASHMRALHLKESTARAQSYRVHGHNMVVQCVFRQQSMFWPRWPRERAHLLPGGKQVLPF